VNSPATKPATMTINVTKAFKRRLRKAAAAEDKNISDYVRDLLDKNMPAEESFFSSSVYLHKQDSESQETNVAHEN
jgi:hypothetical protein